MSCELRPVPPRALTSTPIAGAGRDEVALPRPRGPLSSWVVERLAAARDRSEAEGFDQFDVLDTVPAPLTEAGSDAWSEDHQLALYVCHHLHLGAWASASLGIEWDPTLIEFRTVLEDTFLRALNDATSSTEEGDAGNDPAAVVGRLRASIAADDSPSVVGHLERGGTLDEVRDAVVARAAYQLTEGDFHTFAIPRLRGRVKQLLAGIQAGEYGADAPDREIHADLFAHTMAALGLDHRPYALLDRQGASALAISNLISTLALRASCTAALVGHLALFEMTSVEPMARWGRVLRSLSAPEDACRFYDVHVLADAEHEHMAADMVTALVEQHPAAGRDVLFGVAAALHVERRYAQDLVDRWTVGTPTPALVAAG